MWFLGGDDLRMPPLDGTMAQMLERPIARRDAQVRPQRAANGEPVAITPYGIEEILDDLLRDRLRSDVCVDDLAQRGVIAKEQGLVGAHVAIA